ncbi:MAG: hypothetical protein AAGM22_07865 [Acidobacteriota bacterium]
MPRMRAPQLIKIVAFNVALTLVLTELLALGVYWYRSGDLYYRSRPTGRSQPVDLTGGVEQFRLHPYFGFANRPSGPLNNNHGFVSKHDYPYRPSRDEFVVGVFGGSVAAELAVFEAEHRHLARRLEAHLGLKDGRVTVLNFAIGGFKQPQQWLVYGYFRALGQRLDLVVNIDGFNELALTGRNRTLGVAAEMPSIDHVKALRDVTGQAGSLDGVERMQGVRSAWRRFATTFNRAWGGEAWELTFASGFLVDFLIYKFHLRRHRQLLAEHVAATGGNREDSWLLLTPSERPPAADIEASVEVWRRSSALLADAQGAAGGRYLHFIQPNQYVATDRVFSDAERAIAFSEASAFAEFIRDDYGRLLDEVDGLRADGVAVESLVELFDGVDEPIYKDNCCHYNDLGQRLLAEAIADAFEAEEPPPVARASALAAR